MSVPTWMVPTLLCAVTTPKSDFPVVKLLMVPLGPTALSVEVPRQVPHPDEMCPGTLVEMFPQLDGYYVSITRHN